MAYILMTGFWMVTPKIYGIFTLTVLGICRSVPIRNINPHKVQILVGGFVVFEIGGRSCEIFVLLLETALGKRVAKRVVVVFGLLRVLEETLVLPLLLH